MIFSAYRERRELEIVFHGLLRIEAGIDFQNLLFARFKYQLSSLGEAILAQAELFCFEGGRVTRSILATKHQHRPSLSPAESIRMERSSFRGVPPLSHWSLTSWETVTWAAFRCLPVGLQSLLRTASYLASSCEVNRITWLARDSWVRKIVLSDALALGERSGLLVGSRMCRSFAGWGFGTDLATCRLTRDCT